jgi:hypothetical protein
MSRWQTAITKARQFDPRSVPGLALWLDGSDASTLYTTDAGPVTAVAAPTDISGCVGWYDASDAASITQSGGLVSQWNDKSGNNRHATASGGARPTLTAGGLNGRSVVTFDGTDDQMLISSGFLQVPNVTILSVFKYNSGQYGGIISSALQPADDSSPRLVIHNGSFRTWGYSTFSDTPQGTSPTLVTGRVQAGASSIFQSGLLAAAGAASGSLTTGSTQTAIGSYRTNTGNHLNGYIAEIVVFDSALSTSDRARVEAYLAAKWGVTGVHAQAAAASDPVGHWGDKSGNGRHATQSTAANRPSVGSQGGRTAVAVDGNAKLLNLSSNMTMSGGGSLFIAVQRTADNSGGMHSLSGHPSSLHHPAGTAYYDGFASTARHSWPQPYITHPHIYGVVSGSDWSAHINGALVNYVASHTRGNQTAGYGQVIGANPSTAAQGRYLEVLAYTRNLSSSERQRIERYLAGKWGITLAPQVSNADAQDWVNRVYANGGTVSASTASAVNTFCNAIDAAGIRDRFYRLNLFCGTGLNACLVPLFRGPSLGGTQYGNTTDTNNNFVSGDYNESGAASGGLKGNGTTKYLDTGLTQQTINGSGLGHLSVYARHRSYPAAAASYRMIGTIQTSPTNDWYFVDTRISAAGVVSNVSVHGGSSNITSTSFDATTARLMTLSRLSSSDARTYSDATEVGSDTTSRTIAAVNANMFVFAENRVGTGAQTLSNITLAAYSMGLNLTASQVSAFYSAMNTFQAALSRNSNV